MPLKRFLDLGRPPIELRLQLGRRAVRCRGLRTLALGHA
jgi:hypothetical protein